MEEKYSFVTGFPTDFRERHYKINASLSRKIAGQDNTLKNETLFCKWKLNLTRLILSSGRGQFLQEIA